MTPSSLIWINGPFGGGKTQTAFEIHRRLPGSFVADPEELGFGIHRMLPRSARPDFQSFTAWRRGVREVLDLLLRSYDGTVIVPMTLVVPTYFEEVIGGLRADGHTVYHFGLLARRETLERRLRGRVAYVLKGDSWAMSQIDRCLDALWRPEFAEQIHTDALGVSQVAERVARRAGIDLRPTTDGAMRGTVRRARVSLRHIRIT